MKLFVVLAPQIRKGGLRELTLTTNGTRHTLQMSLPGVA
jgi:hypothetical protein